MNININVGGQALQDSLKKFERAMNSACVLLQRIYLYKRLKRWLPEEWADWIAYHWPERWLPALPIKGDWLGDSEGQHAKEEDEAPQAETP